MFCHSPSPASWATSPDKPSSPRNGFHPHSYSLKADGLDMNSSMRIKHKESVMVMCVVQDPPSLITGCQDHSVNVFDLVFFQCRHTLRGHKRSIMSMNTHDNLLITAGTDRIIIIWDMKHEYDMVAKIKLHGTGHVLSLAIPKDLTLVLGCQDTNIRYCNLQGHLPERLEAVEEGESLSPFYEFSNTSTPLGSDLRASIAVGSSSPTSTAASEGFFDHTVTSVKWSLVKHHVGYVYALAADSSGKYLFSGSGDSTIGVWSTNDMTLRKSLDLHTGAVYSLLVHQNYLYSGSQDCTIRLWDIDTLGCMRTLSGHKTDVMCLSASLNHKLLFSGDSDGVIRVWDEDQYYCLRELFTKRNVLCVISAGDKLFSASNDKSVQIWSINRPMSVESESAMIPQSIEGTSDDWSELVDTLKELIAFQSVSGDDSRRDDCWRCAKYLQSLLESIGAEVRVTQSKDKRCNPCILARVGNDADRQTITFYGHYDVQPADVNNGWRSNPFNLSGCDGYIYGRGVSDDKGPLLLVIFAVKDLIDAGTLGVNVVFVIEGEGEHGSEGFDEIVEANFDIFEGTSCILISNNYWLGEVRPCLTYGLRGQIQFSVTVYGAKTILHSGVDGGLFLEPMIDLVRILGSLVDTKTNKVMIPHFYDSVASVTDLEEKLYDDLDFDFDAYKRSFGMDNNDLGQAFTAKEALMQRWRQPSLTIHNIETPVINGSVIPNIARANISIRIVPNQSLPEISQTIKDYLQLKFDEQSTCNKLEVVVRSADPWWLGNPNGKDFQKMSGAISKVWGVEPSFVREGGTVRVTTYLEKALNSPAIHFPVGQSSDRAHLDNERIRLENLYKGKEVLLSFFAENDQKV